MKIFKCLGYRPGKEKWHARAFPMRRHAELVNRPPMRIVLLIFLMLQLILMCTNAEAQQITASFNKTPFKQVINELERQSHYQFFFDNDVIKQAKPITAIINKLSLKDALDRCFQNQPVVYEIIEKTIVIKEKPKAINSGEANPDKNVKITGMVSDEKGNPLPGASVRIKGTNHVTVTNSYGQFTLPLSSSSSKLEIVFVGYEPSEVLPVDGMTIRLKGSTSSLDEVQVIAYGTTTRRLNTGSVSTLKAEDIERQPISNPLAAIQGRLPGVVVSQSSGLPGGSFKVEVRGRTAIDRSISDDQPLIVIDGVPYGANNGYLNLQISSIGNPSNASGVTSPGGISPLNSINPQDIETVDILKDADATAIYGSRGANGVIMITTKKGKAGQTHVNFNAASGISQVTKKVDMMNTEQYIKMRLSAYLNDGSTPTVSNGYDIVSWDTSRYTDFTKLFTDKDAAATDIQLSISGGSANTQFLAGGSFNRQSSVLPGNQFYQRGTTHFNIGHNSPDGRFKLNLSSLLNTDVNNQLNSDLSAYYYLPPNLIVYDNQGNLGWNEGGIVSYANPLSFLEKTYQAKNKGLAGNIGISYNIVDQLKIRLNGGYNMTMLKEISLSPIRSVNPVTSTKTGAATLSDNQFSSWILEPQLEYAKRFGGGNLTILLGGTVQATDQIGQITNGAGYNSDDLLLSIGSATTLTATNLSDQYRYQALFARLNYNFANKYILNLSARRDGSSRFAPENRFANFASAGAAWLFTNENLLKNSNAVLSFGKIRASYGSTGNDKITNYQFLDTWMATVSTYNGAAGLYPNKLYNPNYHWEKTNKFELAVELGFLKDRILFSAAYYNNRSSNQLVQYPLPILTGFTSVIDNMPALVENKGLEVTLGLTNIASSAFNWTTNLNLTVPKNTLISYPGLMTSSYANTYVTGQSLNVIYRYRFQGLNDQTGLYMFEDLDGNGIYNVRDRQALGNLDPQYYGGLQNSISYKGIQLDFLFSFTKQTGKNYLSVLRSLPGSMNNLPAIMTDFWTGPGHQAQFQKLSTSSSSVFAGWTNLQVSDGIYSDASYIRLKNVSLGYRFPAEWLKALHCSNARVYLQGQNLLTITGFDLIDPEVQNLNRTATMRTVTAGIQFEL